MDKQHVSEMWTSLELSAGDLPIMHCLPGAICQACDESGSKLEAIAWKDEQRIPEM